MNSPLLKASGINKQFSGVSVLENAFLQVEPGEIHALVGANGAGKSTLIKVITAAHQADSGQIMLEGEALNCRNPKQASEAGISAVYQEFSLISDLSVAENIFLGHSPKTSRNLIDWKEMQAKAQAILDTLESPIKPKAIVRYLSVAERQIVEIAKALSYESKVLIMDEPTSSLSEEDVQKLFKVMRSLSAKGMGIIYVSHRLEELPQIAHKISVYRDGRYITTLDIDDAPKSVIIEQMVGNSISVQAHQKRDVGPTFFEAKNLSSPGKFSNISFEVHEGEILGITGLAGAGRTELVRALFGADPLPAGELFLDGKSIKIKSPRQAKANGIGFISEDRKEEGLVLDHSIGDNINLTVLERIKRGLIIPQETENKLSNSMITDLHIKCNNRQQLAKNLSGGNQQKVVIAKWMATKPRLLIMDEPTRGIDVGAKSQIYGLLKTLSQEGVGIIMISSEIPEVLEQSDRVIVMAQGQITFCGDNENLSQDQILDYATSSTSFNAA
ncbi:sugar ABC transporter ATP-binding protein [Alginatibacterium sediminis]|uniref:sugar ABC transporter ATP-binding protein n=1 Tax=Alginatibacterium sediminis TaxID=2164068 RepID=UPI001313F73C|nr:sugar ABC transporter ATP-binding protein [Alginatibacterium sediminis]